ncbi:hypothetical protein [Paraburkholderia sp.]|uniref:hypothetical protein n=1 Tax=Paraburkholderia sp. TaxID=1926495 RepID=UPI00262688E2|nr:hypothetical protein [Paraburkholderia sp.]
MNRPLALIDGDLALPTFRPFDNVPPPFGAYGRAVKAAVKKTVRQIANAEPNRRFLTGTKHIFWYQTSPPREHNEHFDAILAEAKRYLSTDTVRYSSSRLDYVLGAAIFAWCSIGFCWLLATCSTPNTEKTKSGVAKTIASASPHVTRGSVSRIAPTKTSPSTPEKLGTTVVPPLDRIANKPSQSADSPRADQPTMTQSVAHEHAALSPQKFRTRVHVPRMTEANVRARVALNRRARPATHPSISAQPEWTVQPSRTGDASRQTEWLDWAARGHRAPVQVNSAPFDQHWNDHMTQRRITDDPAAFHVVPGRN